MIKNHGQNRQTPWSKSSKTMIKYRQKPWLTIVKHHGQKSSKTMVTNSQNPWSKIVSTQIVNNLILAYQLMGA
jgi:hypothetical protein